jgi:hypothetical protein
MKEFNAIIFWGGVAFVLMGLGLLVYSRWTASSLDKSHLNANLLAAILAWMAGGYFIVRSDYFALPLTLKMILLGLLIPTNILLLPSLIRMCLRLVARRLHD